MYIFLAVFYILIATESFKFAKRFKRLTRPRQAWRCIFNGQFLKDIVDLRSRFSNNRLCVGTPTLLGFVIF